MDSDTDSALLAYFYCANPELERCRRASEDVMRTILGQLALDTKHRKKVKDLLCSEYERQAATASVDKLDLPRLTTSDCVRLILELAELDPLTIVVDAVDSVEENERHLLIGALKEIISKADNVVKILVTSRSNNRTAVASAADKQIQITSHETQQDMEAFVNQLIDSAIESKSLLEGRVSPNLRSTLLQGLFDGAGEMFLWAKLQIDRLCRENIEQDVMMVLQNKLPEDLDQLYQEALCHIFKNGTFGREIAIKTFCWVLYMREPLTPTALLAALSTPDNPTLQLTQLTAICANLVVLDVKSNIVRFAHQSVKEFLGRHETFTSATAQSRIASACIRACSRGPTPGKSSKPSKDDFYDYAVFYWPVHSSLAERMATNEHLLDEMSSFIFDEAFESTLSFELWLGRIRELGSNLANDHAMKPALEAIPDRETGFLFLISVFGLNGLLNAGFSNMEDLDVNQKNERGHTPLYLASALGHSTTASILVDYGADINVECGRYGSPLHAACFAGHVEVVVKLLKLGASLSCGVVFSDALQAAFRGGQETVALHLLESGSMVIIEDDLEQILGGAARAGFVKLVERLQKPPFTSLSRNRPDKVRKKTRKAIEGGQLGVLRQFLDQQANNKDLLPPDAVAIAALYNHKDLVDFLLDEGMEVETEGAFGAPLRTACLVNSPTIVRLLLSRGADINACGSFGDALQIVALQGHTSIVKLLINEGADVNQQTGFYGTSLQAAAFQVSTVL